MTAILRGEFIIKHRNPKVHGLHIDAPMGSAIILTKDQYLHVRNKEDELNARYYEKVWMLANHKDKILVFNLEYYRNQLQLRVIFIVRYAGKHLSIIGR
jgi:hypothetical protein